MHLKQVLSVSWLALCSINLYAQQDTAGKTLGEVVISVNKWEVNLNEVPNKITKIGLPAILRSNPQTSADLLGQTGQVFIQKSQLGGGSPMIRGFATNRVLLVVDGVRMNNAIYRSGNLQNVISIDPLATETAEIIFGPGSLIYGSDAIGGVMDFHSLEARYSTRSQPQWKANAQLRYSTANQEKTGHADFQAGGKKWAWAGSVTYSVFEDLKMGSKGPAATYLRPEYVIRENNADRIVANSDPRVQKFSGYDQWNILQKIRFKAGEYVDIQYMFQHALTGDAPRYDRLTQYRNGNLRFAEWYYGPMKWNLHHLQFLLSKKNKLFNQAKLILAWQDYTESRVDRQRDNENRTTQTERVDALSLNGDAQKKLAKGELFYGLEYVYNKVGSSGKRENINTGMVSDYVSRYPDGSTWASGGFYGSYRLPLGEKTTFSAGLRYSYNKLEADFDDQFIPFPYTNARLKEGALTGNTGLVFRPAEGWQLNTNISTGFRMPNVDDLGKLFESVPGNITVPNPNLRSEYAWNFELGMVRHLPRQLHLELNIFHTRLENAIVRRPFTFNGEDSIVFDGTRSRVEALQNLALATVWGFQASAEIFFANDFSFLTHLNFIQGKETDDINDEQVPLRHAPPFYGSSYLKWRKDKFTAEAFAFYNSEISYKNLAPSEQSKTNIYARDANGNPYSPGWYTLNLRGSWQAKNNLLLTAGWENITNQRYRPYSSGIVAAGSNLIVSLRIGIQSKP